MCVTNISGSAQWKLSTSGLSAGLLFKGTGFGAMYDDGDGINCEYFIVTLTVSTSDCLPDLAAPGMVKLGIESKFSSPLTSTQEFKEAISNALLDMQALCQSSDNGQNSRPTLRHL